MTRLFATLLLASAATTACAQSVIAPPLTGLILDYQYWPEQYVQFVGPELPYSMIELDVNAEGKGPIYLVTLTDRAGAHRVQYSNDDAVVTAAKAEGREAYKTAIAFEPPESTNINSVCTLRFSLPDGKPLQWRFVQGSDISEQGSGLTALKDIRVPVLAYREQGAVAGEGTVLQVGDTVSQAEVWKEISRLPYFVAYHGAYTQNAHRLTFAPGKESWTVASAPASLAAGGVWELDGERGIHRTLKIERVEGTRYTVSGTDRLKPGLRWILEATRTGDAWTVERIRYVPGKNGEKHPFSVQFTPGIGTAATTSSTMEVTAGKKTAVASGTLTLSGEAADRTALLEMKTPAWARGKSLAEETQVAGQSYITTAHIAP